MTAPQHLPPLCAGSLQVLAPSHAVPRAHAFPLPMSHACTDCGCFIQQEHAPICLFEACSKSCMKDDQTCQHLKAIMRSMNLPIVLVLMF